jgi:hypothetical protein
MEANPQNCDTKKSALAFGGRSGNYEMVWIRAVTSLVQALRLGRINFRPSLRSWPAS